MTIEEVLESIYKTNEVISKTKADPGTMETLEKIREINDQLIGYLVLFKGA